MTDNDIIKDLDGAELFLRTRTADGMSLKLNEYDIEILKDISSVCARAYDEINRQKEEIARLTANTNAFKLALIREADGVKTERAEAIKEFVETLREYVSITVLGIPVVAWADIDNLVKKWWVMMGDRSENKSRNFTDLCR